MAQLVKNPPAMEETWVRPPGWEDSLEKGKDTHSSILGLETSMDCIVHGVTKSRTGLSDPHFRLSYRVKVKVKSLSCVQLFATPWTVAYQAPLSMGFSRQEYWSGLPSSSPNDKSYHLNVRKI